MIRPQVRLEVREVRKAYGGLRAVENVSLQCETGEVLAVIGPNGAGKTTLFGLISGDVPCDSGHIVVDGDEVQRWPAARRARAGVSRTFQVAQIMSRLTVHDNLTMAATIALGIGLRVRKPFGSSDVARERASESAATLGLTGILTKTASTLSQGERKRLDIGMALAQRPKIILLDEPTAGMGPEDVRSTTATLVRIHEEDPEVSIVLTAHDMDVIFTLAEKVAVMVDGQIVATDTPAAIRASEVAQAAYLGHGRLSGG